MISILCFLDADSLLIFKVWGKILKMLQRELLAEADLLFSNFRPQTYSQNSVAAEDELVWLVHWMLLFLDEKSTQASDKGKHIQTVWFYDALTTSEVSIGAITTSVNTCVPVVVAAGPGQLGAEGEHQVEQGPGQDEDVGHAAVEEDQLSAVADSCMGRQAPPFIHKSPLSVRVSTRCSTKTADSLQSSHFP